MHGMMDEDNGSICNEVDQLYKIDMSTFLSRQNGITYPILAKFARDVFASLAQLWHLSLQFRTKSSRFFQSFIDPK